MSPSNDIARSASPWNGTYSSTKAALHLMTDTLSMECGFLNKNIKVTLVVPGAVKTNISNGASSFGLPPHSLFKNFTQVIYSRMMASQGPTSIMPEDFARQVVPQVLRTDPPGYMTLGGLSTAAAIAQWFPRFLIRWVMGRMFGKSNQS